MKRRWLGTTAALLGLAGLVMAAKAHYVFSPTGNYPGANYTIPLGDNLTQVVGYYETQTSEPAYLETFPGSMVAGAGTPSYITIGPPGSGSSYASGINASNVAVGGFCAPPGCNPLAGEHGFTWTNGTDTTIDYPGAGSTVGYGINDLGQIVGGYCDSQHTVCPYAAGLAASDHGFLDINGIFTVLNYPAAQATQANAINNAGVVVGIYTINNTEGNGFIYENGTFNKLMVPGSGFTYPSAINNHGVVAGYYQGQNFTVHGFLYHDGKFVTVDYPNTNVTGLTGINDKEVLVGNWAPPLGQRRTFKGIPVR